jgi:hypothetical protein
MAKHDSLLPPPSVRLRLEEAFFLAEDRRLIEKLRTLQKMEETKQALTEVSGITDDAVLTRLVEMGIESETLAAIAVVPLIEVAWADGEVDEKERKAILSGLGKAGVAAGGIEQQLVESWLEHRPEPKLLDAWRQYLHGLCEKMTEAERTSFRDEVMKSARAVAEASGGVAGLFKVSAAERDMLDRLQAAFC